MCQVALAYSALLVGRKATVFLNTARSCKANPPPLTHLAMRYVCMYVTRPLANRYISKLLLNTDDLNNANKTFKFMYVSMYVWYIGVKYLFCSQPSSHCYLIPGVIPVNKNLWSTSFCFLNAGTGLVGLSFCYLLVDVWKLWSGAPFLQLGMNRSV